MSPTTTINKNMSNIKHPIEKGTRVKYLSPKCPCQGKGYKLKEGKVAHTIEKNGTYIYQLANEPRRIPQLGIVQVL